MKLLSLLLVSLPLVAAAQSQQHLVAHSMYRDLSTGRNMVDSAQYQYTSNKPAYLPATENWNNDLITHYNKTGLETQRERRKFDANGRISEMTLQNPDGSTWIDQEQRVYSYDASGNITAEELWTYSTATSSLGKQSKYDYSYDVNGRRLGYTTYRAAIVSGVPTFVPDERITYTYTGSQLTQMLMENYVSGSWKTASRATYSYPTATTAEELYEDYDGTAWSLSLKILNTLNAAQQLLRSEGQRFTGSFWESVSAQYYSYHSNGKMLSHETKRWVSGIETGENLYEWTYNSDNNMLTVVSRMWNGSNYAPTSQIYYYYAFPTSVSNAPEMEDGIQIYPVPTGDNIYVTMQAQATQPYKAVLYDATGRIAKAVNGMAMAGAHTSSINVQDLPAGNYVLHLNTGTTVATRKVVIAR